MNKIVVYTKNRCAACTQTKKWLQRNKIEYTEINVSTNPEEVGKIKSLGFLSVPVVITDTDAWSGFNLDKLKLLTNIF